MSIDYYDENAADFIGRTHASNMSPLTERFFELIGDKGRILDLGCGSGRDAKTFLDLGYDVYAVDGSKTMIDHVKSLLGEKAILASFEAFETDLTFDGIWASASLLHVAEEDLMPMISKYAGMLNKGGVFYMSFKNREEHYQKDGRHFTCYDEKRLLELLLQVDGLKVEEVFETEDVREGRNGELWINAFCWRI